jgi:MoxR-like ATPase
MILRGWNSGRIVSLTGETGAIKTTLGVFLAQLMGFDYYLHSSHGQSKVRDLTAELKIGRSGRYELEIKEFFKRIGKDNQIIIFDEANIRPEILWVLTGIARGERKFSFEMPGEAPFEVRLGKNVFFLMPMNPENYSGRGEVPVPLLEDIHKIWAPADYPEGEFEDILTHFMELEETGPRSEARAGIPLATVEELLEFVEKRGWQQLRSVDKNDLQRLERQILARPDVVQKMAYIRTAVGVSAPTTRLIFTLFGWWSIAANGGVITVPLYELVKPGRSEDAVIGLILHELRHHRYSLTRGNLLEAARDLGAFEAAEQPAFHDLWNAVEDIRIDHIEDPSLP